MGKKFSNVETYFGILFVFAILISGLIYLGNELIDNDNADLDNDSIIYIANLQGINLTDYEATRQQIEFSNVIPGNATQGNPKDQGLDLMYGKEKGLSIEATVKGIFSLPSVIFIDLLRFNLNDWNWIISILNWVYRLLILVAVVYFVRGIIRN